MEMPFHILPLVSIGLIYTLNSIFIYPGHPYSYCTERTIIIREYSSTLYIGVPRVKKHVLNMYITLMLERYLKA